MYPVSPPFVYVRHPRPVGTFVITRTEAFESTQTKFWVEKVTAHTEHRAEVLSRWCEAVSERKAYLIVTALNRLHA